MTATRSLCLVLATCCAVLSGCAIGKLFGGMMQNYEYSKLVEVHPAYSGLENQTVAVIVDVDMATQFEYPDVQITLAANISKRIQQNVPGARVLPATVVGEWQFRTPQWSAMPYGQIAEELHVSCVVQIDLYEYRLHPMGNQWVWDGVCAANVGIIEGDGLDPDSFVDMFTIDVKFPDMPGVTREDASADRIQMALMSLFVRETSWLFFTHLEPKYEDYYKGPIEEGRYAPDR
jgi:hypothetical protein